MSSVNYDRPAFWKHYETPVVTYRKKGLLKQRPASYHGHHVPHNGAKHRKRVRFCDEVSNLVVIPTIINTHDLTEKSVLSP